MFTYKDWLQKSQHDNTVEEDGEEETPAKNEFSSKRFVALGTSDYRQSKCESSILQTKSVTKKETNKCMAEILGLGRI